jgi:phosphoribosylglycinamide formyltransferase-1
VHEAVLGAGETESGSSVHLVEAEYDTGRVLSQASVPVLPSDTPETLAARVQERERRLVVAVLGQIADGELALEGLAPRG